MAALLVDRARPVLDRTPSLTSSDSTTPDSDGPHELRPTPSVRRPLPTIPIHKKSSVHTVSSQSTKRAPSRPRARNGDGARLCGLDKISSHPRVFAYLLEFLPWSDFYSLSGLSRSFRGFLLQDHIKDIVFARFVSGYCAALGHRDRRNWQDVIRMDYGDLNLLIASMNIPLSRYPKHALSVLSSRSPAPEQRDVTARLQQATLVHSRVVLLLQSMVHSSSHPLPSDLYDPQWKPSSSPPKSVLRELTFPAPLSYFNGNTPRSHSVDKRAGKGKLSAVPKRLTKSETVIAGRGHGRRWGSESDAGPSRSASSPGMGKRLSIFGGNVNRPPLPPPAFEPASLRFYSGNWRRNTARFSIAGSDDEGVLRPPKRRFLSSGSSSQSSLGSSPTAQSTSRQSASPSNTGHSPHDLQAATNPTRAPILRVFVPCSDLTDDVVDACEDQLIEAGLWEHLSVGDVVCNFGFVPLTQDEPSTSSSASPKDRDHRRWLVFTGDRLLIYYPTESPPIATVDVLNLPSPFYYTHLLSPTTGTQGNPRLELALPPHAFRVSSYSLANLSSTITSPHSPSGFARVKTFAWLANVEVSPHSSTAVSSGWAGEWILQGEGTREGKMALQRAVKGGQDALCTCEVVLDKCGNGKLWLRLLPSVANFEDPPDSAHIEDNLDHGHGHNLRTPP